MRKSLKVTLILAILLLLSGCAKNNLQDPNNDRNVNMTAEGNQKNEKVGLDYLKGKRAGVMTGTPQEELVKKVVDDVTYYYFNNFTDLILALEQNKVDFIVNNNVAFSLMQDQYPDFATVDGSLCAMDIGTVFPKNTDNNKLVSQFNEYIENIKADGTLDELKDYWLNNKNWEKITLAENAGNDILKLATCTSNKPFSMMIDGGYAGFDVAIVNGFCQKYGYGLVIEDSDFAGMLSGIANGKYDLAAGQIAYTDERAQNVVYSDFYYTQNIIAIIKGGTGTTNKTSFMDAAKSGFKKTFIDESRYKMILSGIKVTMIITIFGFMLAIAFGIVLCAMTMSKYKILKMLANIYSKVMQGTPIVVVLMIIYYIIFAKSSISNVLVAIIAFGASTAANISQIYYGAINQVNIGEVEAAKALGFTKRGAFMGIVLPQAIRFMLPSLGSQLVGLMKGTAIVGYIAVMDMTKVSDIIRSSTYEAIFPLFSIAFVYFAISTVILLIFDYLVYWMNPANRKRRIKGV